MIQKKQEYACCFCNQDIASNNVDITSLLITINFDKNENVQHSQQFFCHYTCLKASMYPGAPLYVHDLIDID